MQREVREVEWRNPVGKACWEVAAREDCMEGKMNGALKDGVNNSVGRGRACEKAREHETTQDFVMLGHSAQDTEAARSLGTGMSREWFGRQPLSQWFSIIFESPGENWMENNMVTYQVKIYKDSQYWVYACVYLYPTTAKWYRNYSTPWL